MIEPKLIQKSVDTENIRCTIHTIILGAGANTRLYLESSDSSPAGEIRAILDDDPQLWNSTIAGVPVHNPHEYPCGDVRQVIIASQMYEPQLRHRASELFDPETAIVNVDSSQQSLPAQFNDTVGAIGRLWEKPQPGEALWFTADRLHNLLEKRLASLPTWRYGPQRQVDEFLEFRNAVNDLVCWDNLSMLNFGCGRYHPLGLSLLAHLTGASMTTALDLLPIVDPQRTARATSQLIWHILQNPVSALGRLAPDRDDLLARIEKYIDLTYLSNGSFTQAVISEMFRYRVESIFLSSLPEDSFDLIISRDVMEHLSDVSGVLRILHRLAKPGGVVVLIIDFSDHRRYNDSTLFWHWSHLTEIDTPAFLNTNRLRFPQYSALFEQAGFEIKRCHAREVEPVPADAKATLLPIYRRMKDDDLAIVSTLAVLRKPD